MGIRHHLIVLAFAAIHCPRIAYHFSLGHRHFGVDIGLGIAVGHFKDGGCHAGIMGINHIILSDMALSNQGNGAQELILTERCFYRILLQIRLDAYHVVGTLVAHNLGRGDVHQLDIFGHDDMGSDLTVHVDLLLGSSLYDNTEKTKEK